MILFKLHFITFLIIIFFFYFIYLQDDFLRLILSYQNVLKMVITPPKSYSKRRWHEQASYFLQSKRKGKKKEREIR